MLQLSMQHPPSGPKTHPKEKAPTLRSVETFPRHKAINRRPPQVPGDFPDPGAQQIGEHFYMAVTGGGPEGAADADGMERDGTLMSIDVWGRSCIEGRCVMRSGVHRATGLWRDLSHAKLKA